MGRPEWLVLKTVSWMGQGKPPRPAQRLPSRAPVPALLPRFNDSPLGKRVTHRHQQALRSCPHPPHQRPQPMLRKETAGRHFLLLPCLLPPKGTPPKCQLQKMLSHWCSSLQAANHASVQSSRETSGRGVSDRGASCGCGRGQLPDGPSRSLPCRVSTGGFARASQALPTKTAVTPTPRAPPPQKGSLGRFHLLGPGVREDRPRKLFCPTAGYQIIHYFACML